MGRVAEKSTIHHSKRAKTTVDEFERQSEEEQKKLYS